MDIDNVTVCYQAIQRVYRNAVVERVRQRFSDLFAAQAVEKAKAPFKKEWDEIQEAARQSRASGELSTPIRDDFDVLGVNHFYNLFELYFDELFPAHLSQPKKEKALAKQAILGWARTIKNLRDPLSHPAEADFTIDDARQMLYCARNILDAMQLFEDADKILAMHRSLDGEDKQDLLAVRLPPADEVVTHFVGRKSEMLHLRRWFEDPNAPRWALAGDGGKGKSAIAYNFACEVAQTGAALVDAVIWLSAKRRRFVQGQATAVDRPDFHDQESVVDALLGAYGESVQDELALEQKEAKLLEYLTDLPALLVIDDIDTLEGEGLEAVQFLVDLPVRTKSKLLLTSRRVLFGLEPCTTSVSGLSDADASAFISSRCDLMGIDPNGVMPHAATLREVTDASPLYIEDLLRLSLAGLSIQQAIGLWRQRRGAAAREYAVQREFEKLPDDAKEVLFVLSLMDRPCTFDELRTALDWHQDRVLDAQQSLRQMFLMPKVVSQGDGDIRLSLNNNTKLLVQSVFASSARFERVQRRAKGVLGQLETTAAEDRLVSSKLDMARAQVSRLFREHLDMTAAAGKYIEELTALEERYPGRSDIPAMIGWLHKRLRKVTDAREAFKRSSELQCKDPQMFWHWSDMEAAEEEWEEAIRIAEIGRKHGPFDASLLYCLGYAQSRRGRELATEEQHSLATPLLKKAEKNLEAFLESSQAACGFLQQCRTLRALVLNADALSDGKAVAKYVKRWVEFAPDDRNLRMEYERMRIRYPEQIPPIEDGLPVRRGGL